MAKTTEEGVRLRARLDEATRKGNVRETLSVLEALAKLEPQEPRWPHRLGEAWRKAGRNAEAEAAWVKAIELFQKQGFLPRAIAVARQLCELNPARSELLSTLNPSSTRELRAKALQSPAFRAPPIPSAALRPASAPRPPPLPPPLPHAARPAPVAPPASVPIPKNVLRSLMAEPAPASAPVTPVPAKPRSSGLDSPSFVGGMPAGGFAALAKPLAPALDVTVDEIRYDDVPAEESVAIEIADVDLMSVSSLSRIDDPELSEAIRAERAMHLSATTLFADVSKEALAELARASAVVSLGDGERACGAGEPAQALFVMAEGTASMLIYGPGTEGLGLTEGQAFGEGALLRGGTYPAEVLASGPVTLLRIETEDLRRIAEAHADVHRALFDLLTRRLLALTLLTSPLFAAFDTDQKRELARMFEVRRAAPGIVLAEKGKRCDALYVALAGEFEVVQGDDSVPLPPGRVVGHEALLTQMPSRKSVIVMSDSIVLRMPASKFGVFAAQFPPALAYLTDVASTYIEP